MHISIGANHLFDIWGFPVTNTILTSWLVVILLVVLSLLFSKHIKKYPNGRVAFGFEGILSKFMDFMETFAGSRKTVRMFLPIVATIFFYVLTANWAGTLPGVETIGLVKEESHIEEASHGEEHAEETADTHAEETHGAAEESHGEEAAEGHGEFVPLFRTVNSDLNMTLVLALIIVIGSHIAGFASIGAKHHVGKFIVNPFKNPIGFFVGLLELIGEVSRIVSLAFRLFGNIFAGSVLMLIISFLAPFILPLPFLGLELFVGFIQALVISVLAMMFFSAATVSHHEEHSEAGH